MNFNDPRWADTSNAIAGAILGPDPRQRAQSEAYLGSASRDYAAAGLDKQTRDYREQIVQAIMNPNTRAAMAYAAGAGGQYATGATPLIAGQAALPGSDVSPEIASNISAVMGVQGMGDTPVGMPMVLRSQEKRTGMTAGATVTAANIAAAQRQREADQALTAILNEVGQAVYAPASEAVGARAPVSKQDALGSIISQAMPGILAGTETNPAVLNIAEAVGGSSTPRNYATPDGRRGVTLDGRTDTATGQPIPAGSQVFTGAVEGADASPFTTATQSDIEADDRTSGQLENLIDLAITEATANPGAFGAVGRVNRFTQDLGAQAELISEQFGGAIRQEFPQVAADLQEAGIDPQFYDPGLNVIDQLAITLAYMDAKASDPGGRVTDRDFQASLKKVGDPSALLSTPQKFVGQLESLRRQSRARRGEPQAEPSGAARQRQQFSGGGDLPAPTTQAEWEALPSGQSYRSPDGKVRTKP